MVLTASSMMPLGTKAPDFSCLDTISGKNIHLNEIRSEIATVIMFLCNHCPYVKHVLDGIVELVEDYQSRGISFVAINSNDAIQYPEDSPEKMRELAKNLGDLFPYLFDETQEIAQAYMATCTPDFYIFDQDGCCTYRGQLDDSRPGNRVPVTGKDIRTALDNILAGTIVNPNQKPSIGCNIKWKN